MALNGNESPCEQHYSLKWNDYSVKLVTAFQSLREEQDFVDVTVACDGRQYSAHRMVLSACSPYFRTMLKANPCKHPIVILKDVGCAELERLLEFMYNGEVNIAQDQLAAFLRTAESLKIRGLAGGGAPTPYDEHTRRTEQQQYTAAAACHPQQQQLLSSSDNLRGSSVHLPQPLPKKRKLIMTQDHSSDNINNNGSVHDNSRRPVEQSLHLTGTDVSLLPLKLEPADCEADDFPPDRGDPALHLPSNSLYGMGADSTAGEPSAHRSASPDAVAGCEALNLSVRPHLRASPPPHQFHHTAVPEQPHLASPHHEYLHHHHQRHHSAPGVVRGITTTRFSSTMLCDVGVPHGRDDVSHPASRDEAYRCHSIGPAPRDVDSGPYHHQAHHHPTSPPSHNGIVVGSPEGGAPYPVKLEYLGKQERLDAEEDSMDMGGEAQEDHLLHASGGHDMEDTAALTAITTILSAERRGSARPQTVLNGGLLEDSSRGRRIVVGEVGSGSGDHNHSSTGSGENNNTNGGNNHTSGYSNHTSTKVYPCSECAKVFRHPMSLHHHRHVHRGTYTCHSCTKVFSRRWDLHRHLHRSKLGCRRPLATSTSATPYDTTAPANCLAGTCSQDDHPVEEGPSSGLYLELKTTPHKLTAHHRPKITIAGDLISPPVPHYDTLTNGGQLYTRRSIKSSPPSCTTPPSCSPPPPSSCAASSALLVSPATGVRTFPSPRL